MWPWPFFPNMVDARLHIPPADEVLSSLRPRFFLRRTCQSMEAHVWQTPGEGLASAVQDAFQAGSLITLLCRATLGCSKNACRNRRPLSTKAEQQQLKFRQAKPQDLSNIKKLVLKERCYIAVRVRSFLHCLHCNLSCLSITAQKYLDTSSVHHSYHDNQDESSGAPYRAFPCG